VTSPIINAIRNGFTASTILNYLSRQFPKAAPAINLAKKSGFLPHTILRQLNRKNDQSQDDDYLTEYEKTERNYKKQKTDAYKTVAKTAGIGALAGAGIAGLMGRGASAAAQGALGAQGGVNTPNIPPGGGGGGPSPGPGIPPAGQINPAGSPANPQNPPGTPAQNFAQAFNQTPGGTQSAHDLANPIDYYTSTTHKHFPHIAKFVEKSLKSGKTPDEIYDNLQKSTLFGNAVRAHESENKSSFKDVIQQIKSRYSPEEKGSIVVTPHGAGEIKETKGDHAYVDVGGKLQKLPLSEVEPGSPEARKSVADYLQIHEKDRSAPIALWFYDPEHKNLWVQWHFEGQVTKYRNFPDDIVEKIRSKAAIPVSTGQNEFGSWSPADEESLGAAVDQFIKKDSRWKKSGKGEEKNPNYDTYELGYDFWEKLRQKRKRPKKV